MLTSQHLWQTLHQLDRQSYGAYKQIRGSYQFAQFTLIVDQVQGDPFAAPSRLRVQVPQSAAGFPAALYRPRIREIALRDYLNRQFAERAAAISGRRGSGNSGLIAIAQPGQQVLERSAVWVDDRQVEARFVVGLPAQGRSILGRQAAELLCEELPQIVNQSLVYSALDASAIHQQVEVVEDADWLRRQLADRGLVAFIPDGAVLPRQSGISDRPLAQALPFQSPDSLRVRFDRPHQGTITGMGIPTGITLIVGGGYHGKSTLLQAIALGVYNHVPGDGREQVVTDQQACKIRAEAGRSVMGVDISAFINHLPHQQSTTAFSSENASGSTSQAASLIEALEAGARVLLIDEDTSATNFMIRDRRMQALIAKDKEPITPLLDRIQPLYYDDGVSTILVMGGSGDYFEVADTVIAMTEYAPENVTAQARSIAQQYPNHRQVEAEVPSGAITCRCLKSTPLFTTRQRSKLSAISPYNDSDFASASQHPEPDLERSPRLKVRDRDQLMLEQETIDLAAVEQLVEVGQVRAIGAAIAQLARYFQPGQTHQPLVEILAAIMAELELGGLDTLTPDLQGDLAEFRSLELAAVLNRWRSVPIEPCYGYKHSR